jgi:alpha-galactosidase
METSMYISLFLFLYVCFSVISCSAFDNGAGKTPPLGWNSWVTCGEATCGHDICNEAEVKSVAQSMQANGMQTLGWNYINLDDCWAATMRDPVNQTLTWDTNRFPSGLPVLINWLHTRGFKFGLYTSAGNQTCSSGGRPGKVPGSRDHYDLDAATFASWGVDYIKLDWCGDIKDEIWEGHKAHAEFAAAVLKTKRSMFLEVVAGYWFFLGDVGNIANSWRFCEDHHDAWKSTTEAVDCRITQFQNSTGSPGAWAYMDFLMTGGAGCSAASHCPGQSDDAYRTEFAVWSITQSPLIVATDVRNMTAVMNQTLLNQEVLAFHQNTSTPPGKLLSQWPCSQPGDCLIFARVLDGNVSLNGNNLQYFDVSDEQREEVKKFGVGVGDWLIALVNMGSEIHDIGVSWDTLGWTLGTKASVYDMWTQKIIGRGVDSEFKTSVPFQGTAYVRITLD